MCRTGMPIVIGVKVVRCQSPSGQIGRSATGCRDITLTVYVHHLSIDVSAWLRRQPSRVLKKTRQHRSRIAQRLNVRRRVRFASLLAAASLDGLFEHPAGISTRHHGQFHLPYRVGSK